MVFVRGRPRANGPCASNRMRAQDCRASGWPLLLSRTIHIRGHVRISTRKERWLSMDFFTEFNTWLPAGASMIQNSLKSVGTSETIEGMDGELDDSRQIKFRAGCPRLLEAGPQCLRERASRVIYQLSLRLLEL
jgi:hypothetical protein